MATSATELHYVRVYSGRLVSGARALNPRSGQQERVRRILSQIAPGAVAEPHDPLAPVKVPEEEPVTEGS